MLSDFQSRMDEGVSNIAFHMARQVSLRHDLEHVCLRPYRRLVGPDFWRAIRRFRPDIIHFVPGPTLKCFLMVKALKMACPGARTVMSAAHPAFPAWSKGIIKRLAPDAILAQSPESRKMFAELGFNTRFVLGGVDTDRFVPVSPQARLQLRKKHGVPENDWVALHVGPLKRGRNVLSLNELARDGVKVIVVGSLTVPAQSDVQSELVQGGCVVWHRYFDNIAEVYGLADCYVFPTVDRDNCVETPLSVLEAMSCNLPVVSTRFRALPHMFQDGDGLLFVGNQREMLSAVHSVRSNGVVCRTREKVSPYSWARVGEVVEETYREVTA